MYSYPVSTTSRASGGWSYSNEIKLNRKWHDGKHLALKVDIQADSTDSSAQLQACYAISQISGGTFAPVVTASGTTILLSSGTSQGGQGSNGSYFVPLTMVPNSGVTELLRAGLAPYIKIGTRSLDATSYFSAHLMVG